jgi:hypothetical protein
MQDLIGRCWQMNPDGRPSFHEILDLFHRCGFAIVANANASQIREFCYGIIEWEQRTGIPQ